MASKPANPCLNGTEVNIGGILSTPDSMISIQSHQDRNEERTNNDREANRDSSKKESWNEKFCCSKHTNKFRYPTSREYNQGFTR